MDMEKISWMMFFYLKFGCYYKKYVFLQRNLQAMIK